MTHEHKALVEALTRKAETDGLLSVEDIRSVAESLSAQSAQPQAGEPVAWRYKLYVADVDWTVSTTKPKGAIVEPLYAAPQPANPAQVTDEALDSLSPEESIGAFDGSGQWIEVCTVAEFRQITAAIGAGGRAVAEDAREALRELANVKMDISLEDWCRISNTILSAISQPHPADERVVEALPYAWANVRVEDTGDGLVIHPDDARKWGLDNDRDYTGSFLPDGRFRIALAKEGRKDG